MIALTRRYEFPAAHVLSHPSLSDERNREIYGRCANPAGHGHNYAVEVTVTGPVDETTGRIIAPELLDEIFEARVAARFARRLLNDDPSFRERVPTAENIALVIRDELAVEIERRSTARVVRVHLVETGRNSSTIGAPQ